MEKRMIKGERKRGDIIKKEWERKRERERERESEGEREWGSD